MNCCNKEVKNKVAKMQRLIDEARASGISSDTMEDIRTRAIRRKSD